jgi:hypothetical protein
MFALLNAFCFQALFSAIAYYLPFSLDSLCLCMGWRVREDKQKNIALWFMEITHYF